MTKEEQIECFNDLMINEYDNIKKKYKQFCFLNKLNFNEDVLHETFLKVYEIISKKGISAKNPKEVENYFFKSFKLNTYQDFKQLNNKRVDNNIDPFSLNIEDIEYDETHFNYAKLASIYILNKVKEEFGELSAAIWRLRYLLKVNGETLNYKQIKQISKVNDVRKRIVDINRWIKQNITQEEIKDKINSNQIF